MKSIDINSSFNVVIKFNLPTVFDRGVAYFIDMAIVWALIGLITAVAPNIFFYVAVPIFGFYTLTCEIINNGQSIGKMAMKLQVVRIDGQRTRTNDYFMRWVFRLIDLYFSAFLLAILTITASQKGQRLGDILSDTTVVKIKESSLTGLKSLIKLNNLKETDPTYPEVIKLSEQDMMVVKETIETYKKFPNEGHKKSIDLLVQHLEELLQIKCKTEKIDFLQILIKEYVILTR